MKSSGETGADRRLERLGRFEVWLSKWGLWIKGISISWEPVRYENSGGTWVAQLVKHFDF